MKRITILSLMIAFSAAAFAQIKNAPDYKVPAAIKPDIKIAKEAVYFNAKPTKSVKPTKAAGSTLFSDDFETDGSKWVIDSSLTPAITWVIDTTKDGNATIDWDYSNAQNEMLIMKDSLYLDTFAVLEFDMYTYFKQLVYGDSEGADLMVLIKTKNADVWSNWTEIWSEDDANVVDEWKQNVNNEDIRIDLSAYEDDTVKIAFHFTSDVNKATFFVIDNVEIYEKADHDLVITHINQSLIALEETGLGLPIPTGTYSTMPLEQVIAFNESGISTHYFEASVLNNGLNDQTNVKLNVEMPGVYTNTGADTSLASAGSGIVRVDTALIFENPEVGYYDINYTVSSAVTDDVTGNNEFSTIFSITDTVYTRWFEGNSYLRVFNQGDFYGTSFHFYAEDTVTAVKVDIHPYTEPGVVIRAAMYKWSNTDRQYKKITTSELYTIKQSDINNSVVLDLVDFTGFDLVVPTDPEGYITDIAVGIEVVTMTDQQSFALWADASRIQDPSNSTVILDNTGKIYTDFDAVPIVELYLGRRPLGIDQLPVRNDLVKVFPNPTNGELNIQGAENAQVFVYNLVGTIVASIDKANAFNTIDMSSFAKGTYLVKVISDEFVATKKVTLIK